MEMTVTTFTALDEEKWKCKFNTLDYSFSFYCSFLPLLSRVNGNVAMLSNFEVLYCLVVVDRSSLVVEKYTWNSHRISLLEIALVFACIFHPWNRLLWPFWCHKLTLFKV